MHDTLQLPVWVWLLCALLATAFTIWGIWYVVMVTVCALIGLVGCQQAERDYKWNARPKEEQGANDYEQTHEVGSLHIH